MREMINYILEANAALLLFLLCYRLFLKDETNFRFLRLYILSAIVISVLVPFVHLNNSGEQNIPGIRQVIPEYWLPEIIVGGEPGSEQHTITNKAYDVWQLAGGLYMLGVGVFSAWLLIQLGYVWIMLRRAVPYRIGSVRIIESAEDKPTFSFFNLIYIGRSNELTDEEKTQIIRHERVHARQLHSADILIVTALGILFWFNPFIKYYKKILIQLHEFEADARAVESSDVDLYCSLLARVALQAHFPIASHFNESLTVKRIEMMRTVKKEIQNWKIAAVAATVMLCFLAIACQDQVLEEVSNSTITQTADYPEEVKTFMANYRKEHPDAKLTYMEGDAGEMDKFVSAGQVSSRIVYNYIYKKNDAVQKKGVLLTDVVQHAENLKTDDKVFMVVEKMPEYVGGFDAMKEFIRNNLKHPGTDGVVYVSMIINEAGAISDVHVMKGVSPEADAEAVRVISMFPNWIPGEQNGVKVKTRFVIPIKFGSGSPSPVSEVSTHNHKMKIDYNVTRSGNEITISGRVVNASANGKALPGVNLIVAGTSQGTTTDAAGNFSIKVEKPGRLVATFVGFDAESISFQ